ncbi:cation diffusion facilitator family transporter [Enterococcus sp. BWT-B8]|uniref:cation diffusion facilitator family transporter n=1 Tax=Enterococcus sp. BWT-B8 TaxID=2885157 RepID=UPI001E333CB2|nr:cation diffusion facilitator family transporter [Enterococcus sp. BWT-B8]MCB5952106.1 cation diffusion facilitator family transporter [Enterococcus sp. BWT-B8]
MIKGILHLFEKKYGEGKDRRTSYGIFAGIIGLTSNLLLVVGKLSIGFFSGSVSIMADAVNNLSDTISSVVTLLGFYIAGKPADREHPYGHERFEYISGTFVSLLITFVGFQFLLTSIDRIREPQSINFNWIMLVVLLVSIFLKVWQGLVYKNIAGEIDSNALIAASKDSLNDVFTTVTVLISTVVEGITGWRIDGYIGLLIAGYIIYSGLQLIREFINELIGVRPDQEKIDEMKKFLSAVQGIVGYHDLMLHQYGPNKIFATVHIEIDDRWDLNRAHQLIDQIEVAFKEQLEVELVCHVDPVNLYDEKQQFVHQQVKMIVKEIDTNFKAHDIRLVDHEGKSTVLFDLVVPSKYLISDEEILRMIQIKAYDKLEGCEVEITFDHNYLL